MEEILEWLGPNAIQFTTRSGDLGMRSQDGLRQVHFDHINFHPHPAPHLNFQWRNQLHQRFQNVRVERVLF